MSTELTFEAATEATEPQLRRLLRDNPLTGDIHVSLEREPHAFHAAGISGDQYQMMLAFGGEPRELIASGGRFELETYINGERQRIGYFGELRAQGGLTARRKLLLGSYRKMREFHEAGDVSLRRSLKITTVPGVCSRQVWVTCRHTSHWRRWSRSRFRPGSVRAVDDHRCVLHEATNGRSPASPRSLQKTAPATSFIPSGARKYCAPRAVAAGSRQRISCSARLATAFVAASRYGTNVPSSRQSFAVTGSKTRKCVSVARSD